MAVTQDDLNEFQRFAVIKLANGGAESMAELVAAWQDHREQQASIQALRQSDSDAESGRVVPAEEVFAHTRKTLGLSE